MQTDTARDGSTSWRRRVVTGALGSLVVLLGLAAFAASLLWFMPVRFVAEQAGLPDRGPMAARRLSGTVWQGRWQIDGGHALTWTARPGASLRSAGFAADWRVEGPGTDLGGRIVLWPNAVAVGPVSGLAGWPLIAAALPGLAVTCDGQARLAAVDLRLGDTARSGSGTITAAEARCARADGQGDAVATPALHAQIATLPDAVQVLVTPQQGPRVPLVTARLTAADRLVITIHRDGAALVPGMPATSDSELDLPLSLLMGG